MQALAIDFDGVIANTGFAKRSWLRRDIGLEATGLLLDRSSLEPIVGAPIYQRMQSCVGFEDTMNAKPLAGAIEIIRMLSKSFSIHVLTARTEPKVEWVRKWLTEYELDAVVCSVVSTCGTSKMKAASEISAAWLIDDDIRHNESGYSPRFLLFGRCDHGEMESIQCARDWQQVWVHVDKQALRGLEVT